MAKSSKRINLLIDRKIDSISFVSKIVLQKISQQGWCDLQKKMYLRTVVVSVVEYEENREDFCVAGTTNRKKSFCKPHQTVWCSGGFCAVGAH